MTAVEHDVAQRVSRRGPALLGRRPELLPVALTIAGWVAVLAVDSFYAVAAGPPGSPSAGPHAGHAAAAPVSPWWALALGCGAMSVAMMGPLSIPGARTVAFTSPWWRSGRAVGWFVLAFCAAWSVLTVPVALLAAGLVGWSGTTVAPVVAVMGCAVLQLVPGRRRQMHGCDRPERLRPGGWVADADCRRFGARSALRGVPLCGPPMLAMLVAPGGVAMMAVISGLVLADRITEGRSALLVAGGYGAIAAAVLLWA